jgi:hypothetical protein
MEATALIRFFLALGAIRNIDWSYCFGTDTKLSQAVCGDEGHFPLDSRPALVQFIFLSGHASRAVARNKASSAAKLSTLV